MDGKLEEPAQPHYFACVRSSRPPPCHAPALNLLLRNSHQVINNACASIALINATLNIRSPDVELGEELTNLQAFSEGASRFYCALALTSRLLTRGGFTRRTGSRNARVDAEQLGEAARGCVALSLSLGSLAPH